MTSWSHSKITKQVELDTRYEYVLAHYLNHCLYVTVMYHDGIPTTEYFVVTVWHTEAAGTGTSPGQ